MMGYEMSIRDFEKLYYIPGNIAECAHAQGRPEKVLSSHLWMTLRLCTNRKRG